MLRTSIRTAARVLAPQETVRMSSLGGMKGYGDKEMGEEIVYFHKEDEKLLKGLLKKVRAQAEKQDSGAAAAADAAEMEQLNKIVGGKLSDAEKKALLEWKHHH